MEKERIEVTVRASVDTDSLLGKVEAIYQDLFVLAARIQEIEKIIAEEMLNGSRDSETAQQEKCHDCLSHS